METNLQVIDKVTSVLSVCSLPSCLLICTAIVAIRAAEIIAYIYHSEPNMKQTVCRKINDQNLESHFIVECQGSHLSGITSKLSQSPGQPVSYSCFLDTSILIHEGAVL